MQTLNTSILNSDGSLDHAKADNAARDARSQALREMFAALRQLASRLAARPYAVVPTH